jgi:dethiobiotin synthetase
VRFPLVLVEGAGGVLSPLGEGFSTRELIAALSADVVVVARNQIGVINHVRLTLEALPPVVAARARVTLMSPRRADPASRTNRELLCEFINETHVAILPWIDVKTFARAANTPRVHRALTNLLV